VYPEPQGYRRQAGPPPSEDGNAAPTAGFGEQQRTISEQPVGGKAFR